ncbi:uncharacterized protein LOC119181866 [Rhipicephalus microplus]|uniref:uncharacterized protein LOC119181866 n=1 Tax=Rhipicephalus microplus TaxID=6941 RepID=UPI003F6CF44D
MVTDTGGFEDHVVVSRRQRRNRAPNVATPAPMSRRRDGWEQHQESETARASLSSLDTVTSVPDFAWPESQTTLSARTEPAGRNAMGDDSPAVPKTSVRKDATGSPLTSRSNAVSHSSDHPDHDADRSRVAVTHLKRDAHVSELRSRERGTPMAEHGEEQSHYRRTRTCKISTDAGRGKKHEERRDWKPAFDREGEEIINYKSCDSSSFGGRLQRSGVCEESETLKRDRQSNHLDDRRVSSEKYCDQYSKKGGRRRHKEDRTAGNVHHDYEKVQWRFDTYDDRSSYHGEKLRLDYEPDHFYKIPAQRSMGASPEEREKPHRLVHAGDWRDYRSNDNCRRLHGTSAEPSMCEQERWTEPTYLRREPSTYSWDSRVGNNFSSHSEFRGFDRSAGVFNYRSCTDMSSDYNRVDSGRRCDGYSHYGYASRSQSVGAYYDSLYWTNPAYKHQVDAFYSSLAYSTAQLNDWKTESAGPLPADARPPNSQNLAANVTRKDEPRLQEMFKFPRPHPVVSFFGANGLVKLVPTVSGNTLPQLVELHSLTPMLQKDPDFRELEAFPGPLIRFETRKEDVIHYCKNKIASFARIHDLPDRSSHVLLWELLVLMLRQNGLVSGTEIAELLVRDYETLQPTPSVLCSRPTCDGDADVSSRSSGVCTGSSFDEDIVVCDGSQLRTTTTSYSIAKFREYLFFGRKKCALEWAVEHGLWGHALSLASRMDAKTHAAMMTRFTNALSPNDPLRTLYEHLSGRQPAAASLVASLKWGDWRHHLAMILSNASGSPEADARNVTTLGDALASYGCLAAAHFCYLVAHVEFGSYSLKSSKIVLLGADHRTLPFRRFASNEAIHCTEIYEYARSLSDPSYALPHLQEYKLLHATRLAEYGFVEEALRYCEVLAVAMAQDCVSEQLAAQTLELANRLKYHVPKLSLEQTELRKIDEAPWLDVLAQITSKHPRVAENEVMPLVGDNSTLYDLDSEEIRLMAEILSSDSGFQSHPIFSSGSDFFACDEDDYALRQPEEYFSAYKDTSACNCVSPPTEQQNPFTEECSAIDASQIQMPVVFSYNETPRQTVEFSESPLPHLSAAPQPSDEHHFAATCPLSPKSQVEVEDKSPLEDSRPPPSSPPGMNSARFYYYSAPASSHSQRPVTSTQGCISDVSSITRPVTTHLQSGNSQLTPGPARQATDNSREAARKSWLEAIFEKLTPKQPNQIILPDDTDPCIVWDEERKCWVDKNAPPGETSQLVAPPPTDSSFGGQLNSYSNGQGQSRYHLSKQRSSRRRYVDLLNADHGDADSNKASGDGSLMSAAVLDQPATTQGAPQFFFPQPTSQMYDNSSSDFVSSAPALDHSSTPAPSLSEASAHYDWPSPMPASTPMHASAPATFSPASCADEAV